MTVRPTLFRPLALLTLGALAAGCATETTAAAPCRRLLSRNRCDEEQPANEQRKRCGNLCSHEYPLIEVVLEPKA